MSEPTMGRRRALRLEPKATIATPSAERIVEEYAALAFSDMRRFLDWGPEGVELRPSGLLTDAEARCVAEVAETSAGSRRLKLHDKKGALDSLARCLGLFIERHELSGRDGAAIKLGAAPDLSRLDEAELRTLEELLAKTTRANGGDLHAKLGAGANGEAKPAPR
jgi:hypothetical protein